MDIDEKCAICLQHEITNMTFLDCECEHFFCFECIAEWSTSHFNCPLCFRTYNQLIHHSVIDDSLCFHSRDELSLTICLWRKRREIYKFNMSPKCPSAENEFRVADSLDRSLFDNNSRVKHKAAMWIEREVEILFSSEEAESLNDTCADTQIISEHVKELVFKMHSRQMLLDELKEVMPIETADRFIKELENFVISPWNLATYDKFTTYKNDSRDK